MIALDNQEFSKMSLKQKERITCGVKALSKERIKENAMKAVYQESYNYLGIINKEKNLEQRTNS